MGLSGPTRAGASRLGTAARLPHGAARVTWRHRVTTARVPPLMQAPVAGAALLCMRLNPRHPSLHAGSAAWTTGREGHPRPRARISGHGNPKGTQIASSPPEPYTVYVCVWGGSPEAGPPFCRKRRSGRRTDAIRAAGWTGWRLAASQSSLHRDLLARTEQYKKRLFKFNSVFVCVSCIVDTT